MKVLGMSCAGNSVGVAVVDEERILGEMILQNPRASEKIPSLSQTLLAELGIDLSEIALISVTKGPGSYSGLRGGLAAAKTIAQARGIALVGVSTLEAMVINKSVNSGRLGRRPPEVPDEGVEPAPPSLQLIQAGERALATAVILARLHAFRSEYNAALFARRDGGMIRLTHDFVIGEEALSRWLSGLDTEIAIAEGDISPAAVAQLGLIKYKGGQRDDPLTLVPAYSHQPAFRKFAMIGL